MTSHVVAGAAISPDRLRMPTTGKAHTLLHRIRKISIMLPVLRNACAAGLLLSGGLAAQAQALELTPAQMREDLTFLKQEWAPQDRSFGEEQKQAFERHVDEVAAAADTLTTEAFALDVMRAAAIARNGHTNANAAALLGPDLPVRLWAFSDGLYIVKAHPDFARLLGARVDAIGSITAQEALERVHPYLSGTDQRIGFLAPGYLTAPAVLQKIGAVDDAAEVPLTLKLADGSTETITLAAIADEDPGDERKSRLERGYGVLLPDAADLPGRWAHLLDDHAALPLSYAPRKDLRVELIGDDQKILYIRNDRASSDDDTPLGDKLAGVFFQYILPQRPEHVVLDLRFNNGGDFFNTILFSQGLPRLMPRDGRVLVLVGKATFSAGLTFAAMLKGAGGDTVVLVGEEMGDAGRFWSEGKYVELPNSLIPVRYSPQFHDYEKGCYEIDECYWPLVAFGPRDISIAPEVAADLSFEAYAQGRDPVLEAALAHVGRR